MKANHYTFLFFMLMIFCYCKKDTITATPAPTIPVAVPFVEYRDSYLGNYKGFYLNYSQIQPNYIKNILDSSSFFTDTINKDIINDSIIISKKFGSFKIDKYGKYYYYLDYSYQKLGFRNDSMFYTNHAFHGANVTSFTSDCKLKKQ